VKQKVVLKDKTLQINGKFNDVSSADENKHKNFIVESLFLKQ
jgi:23S rRNA maturation-related 3'-5' exoribonuclease YhaM